MFGDIGLKNKKKGVSQKRNWHFCSAQRDPVFPLPEKKRRRLSDLTGQDKQASYFPKIPPATTRTNSNEQTFMHDARWIQVEHNSRPAGKPWFGYDDMDWGLQLQVMAAEYWWRVHVCYSEYQQISAFEPNCREPLLYHGQRMCSPFFFSITVVSYRANISPFAASWTLLILKESHHLPLHSASLSAPCGPSLPFIRHLPCRKDFWAL